MSPRTNVDARKTTQASLEGHLSAHKPFQTEAQDSKQQPLQEHAQVPPPADSPGLSTMGSSLDPSVFSPWTQR